MSYKDECPLSEEEIDSLLKALQNDDLTKKVHDMLPNYKAGYEQGYQEAKTEFYENRYQEGLQDAWELAQKIVAMNNRELANCKFEVNIKHPDHINAVNIIADNSVNKALEKIKGYEQMIKVGDEVYFSDSKHKRVVTAIITENGKIPQAVQFSSSGRWVIDDVIDLHKTDKHYDIQSILDGLKED